MRFNVIFALFIVFAVGTAHSQSIGIVATVNDEAISAFDVEARTALIIQSGEIPARTPADAERARERATEELIDEAIKRQEAARLSIEAPQADVDTTLNRIATGNGLTRRQLLDQLGGLRDTLVRRIQTEVAWSIAVGRQFSAEVDVTEAELDAAEAEADSSFVSVRRDTTLRMRQIFVPTTLSADRDELVRARRLAEEGRALASGCEGLGAIHAQLGLEDLSELGAIALSELPPDVRIVVERLAIGRPSRPIRLETGYAVLFVCDRDFVADTAVDRDGLEARLRQQKLATLAERKLRDLRRAAIIERR